MINKFDNRLPNSTTYWIENEIFFIKNTNFFVNLEEGKAIAELLNYAMKEKSTKTLLMDNSEAKGAWPSNISELWESNSDYINAFKNKKTATLTNSAITTMQTNRLAKNNGLDQVSKAFNSKFTDEVKKFLME